MPVWMMFAASTAGGSALLRYQRIFPIGDQKTIGAARFVKVRFGGRQIIGDVKHQADTD